jgi:hypothetical protein
MTQGLLEMSKLAHHAYEEGNKVRVCWNEAKVLQIEPNTTCSKYTESAHMTLINDLISQTSIDIPSTWTLFITAEVKNYNYVKCRLSDKICVLYVCTMQTSLQ